MAGGDGVTLPPIERPAVPEPVAEVDRDRQRRRQEREKRKKKPSGKSDDDKPVEDGKGERVDIRA